MERIRELRRKKELSMKRLGELIGVAESTIHHYEKGKRQPDYETLKKIADVFNVSVDYLLGREENELKPSQPNSKWIPVLGKVAAGIPIEAIEDILDYEEISEDLARKGEYFALQVAGDSMEPKISKGDVVIVKSQPDIESGEIAIVKVNGEDATCKKIVKYESGLSLVSLNPAYEPKFYTNEEIAKLPVAIIGKVVELRAKF